MYGAADDSEALAQAISYLGGWACLWMILCLPFALLGAVVAEKRHARWNGFCLGLLFGPFGFAASFALDNRPKCPSCGGRLEERFGALCPHCRSPMVWTGEKAITSEDHEAAARKRQQLDRSRQAYTRRRNDAILKRCENAMRAMMGLPATIDRGLQTLAGKDNTLVYRFLQLLVIVILPLLIAVVAGLLAAR